MPSRTGRSPCKGSRKRASGCASAYRSHTRPPILAAYRFESQDGQYDVAWSEMNDNQLVSTCGDGSVKLWDLQSPGFPLMSWEEHQAEGKLRATCICWLWSPQEFSLISLLLRLRVLLQCTPLIGT